jgi:hypothetical protein
MLRLIYSKKSTAKPSFSAVSKKIGWSAGTVKSWLNGILKDLREFSLEVLREQRK